MVDREEPPEERTSTFSVGLDAALQARLGGRGGVAHGPRLHDVTVRLSGAADLPGAAAELVKLGFGPAALVATDEIAREGDLKLRWLFEPVTPRPSAARKARGWPDAAASTTATH